MAKEPESLVLRLLRDIRVTQQSQGHMLERHGANLDRLGKRIEDLYKISTNTLGVAANAHVRYEALEPKVEKLTDRVKRLEAKL
jgi:hypothetical protein